MSVSIQRESFPVFYIGYPDSIWSWEKEYGSDWVGFWGGWDTGEELQLEGGPLVDSCYLYYVLNPSLWVQTFDREVIGRPLRGSVMS